MNNITKKVLSLLLTLCTVLMFLPGAAQAALDSRVEKAISWAVAIANDNSHGYSQTSRYGPDYDCSSFVSTAFKQGGFNVSETNWTGSMEQAFTSVGFKAYAAGSVTLQRGDILLRHDNVQQHVELYLGNDQCVAAHWDEDGRTGDSSGREIEVRSRAYCDFCNYKQYTRVLRYEGGASGSGDSKLAINMTDYPKGTLTKGTYYSLGGTVSSNYTINFVQGSVIDNEGKTHCRYSQNPNSTSFSLYNSTLDAKMTFNTLEVGTYYLKIIARDTSGAEKVWRSDRFTVQAAGQSASSSSSITFSPGSVTMNPGESKTVTINFSGDGIQSIWYGEGDQSVCTARWDGVDWSKKWEH